MSSTTLAAPKLTRRGFRKAPADVRAEAERHAADAIRDADDLAAYAGGPRPSAALLTLRPASYCGPDSAGDRGAWMLEMYVVVGNRQNHHLQAIERA